MEDYWYQRGNKEQLFVSIWREINTCALLTVR